MTINMPAKFAGSSKQRRENFLTHYFVDWGDEVRCSECDCKPWHRTASYPCGSNVPRIEFNPETGVSRPVE